MRDFRTLSSGLWHLIADHSRFDHVICQIGDESPVGDFRSTRRAARCYPFRSSSKTGRRYPHRSDPTQTELFLTFPTFTHCISVWMPQMIFCRLLASHLAQDFHGFRLTHVCAVFQNITWKIHSDFLFLAIASNGGARIDEKAPQVQSED